MKKCQYCNKENQTKWKYCCNKCILNAKDRAIEEAHIEKMKRDDLLSSLWRETFPATPEMILAVEEKNNAVRDKLFSRAKNIVQSKRIVL